MTWGGQTEIVSRLVSGYDNRLPDVLAVPPDKRAEFVQQLAPLQMQVPFNVLALQDCVDLALFFLKATIDAQQLTLGIRGCGGPIDVATITRRVGLHYVQRKDVRGEHVSRG